MIKLDATASLIARADALDLDALALEKNGHRVRARECRAEAAKLRRQAAASLKAARRFA